MQWYNNIIFTANHYRKNIQLFQLLQLNYINRGAEKLESVLVPIRFVY